MARGGRPQRSRDQILKDRVEIAARYLEGQPTHVIAAHFGFHTTTITKEMQKIRAGWLESSLVDFNTKKAEELARIDHLEEVAWDAWERSKGQHKRTTQHAERNAQGALEPTRATVTTVESVGDPAFLDRVAWCIQKRLDIFGLEAPKQFKINEREAEIAALLKEYTDLVATESSHPDTDATLH